MGVADAISKFSGRAERMTNKAADKASALVDEGGDNLSDALDSVRDNASPLIGKASKRAQAMANQLRDGVSDLTDGAVAYTKKNPLTAVLIAAASGALVFGLVKALTTPRD